MARAQLKTAGPRACFALLGAAAAAALLSFVLHQPGWPSLLFALVLTALAAVRPFEALLVLAGLGPLGAAFLIVGHDNAGGMRFAEVLVLAFLAGASMQRAIARTPPRLPAALAWTAAPLSVALVASAVTQTAALTVEAPALTNGGTLPIVLARDYLLLPNAIAAAAQFVEGLLLLLLTAALCAANPARRRRVVFMMIIGATAAALINVMRLLTAALAQPPFWRALMQIATSFRINVQYADWNAAGSYFAMLLVVAAACGLARPRRAVLPVALLAAALWLAGSRMALAAAAVALAVLGLIALRRRGGGRAAAVAVLIVLAAVPAAAWKWYPEQRNFSLRLSLSSRLALSAAAVRMAADYPVFGVGVSRYYDLSDDYAGDVLRSVGRERENAHDYFLQLLAELGVSGFVLFVSVLVIALRRAWPPPGSPPAEWGLPLGLLTYLATCLTGHPLMTLEAAVPFWVALGAATSAGVPRQPAPRSLRVAAIGAIVLFAASVPLRAIDAVHHARLENTSIGFSSFQRSVDGVRYRWSAARSAFYVDRSAASILIPFKLGPAAPGPLSIRILVNRKEANRVVVSNRDDWQTVRFVSAQGVRGDFVRVDIEAEPASALAPDAHGGIPPVLAVARPTVLWDTPETPGADVPLAADIDGDGRADLIVWSVDSGRWRWLLSSSNYDESVPGTSEAPRRHAGGTPLLGDLDGDGRADLVVWRSNTATWEWLVSSSAYRQGSARSLVWKDTQTGDVPLVADMDGDGRDDLILWRAASRTWMWRTAASAYASGGALTVPMVAAGAHPMPVAEHGARGRRSAVGLWSIASDGAARLDWFVAGGPPPPPLSWADRGASDIPFLADVDRDATPDLIVWRPSTGMWAWLASSTDFAPATAHEQQWGNGRLGDVPVIADFDGDGAADFAVWRRSTRTWYWVTSSAGYAAAAGHLRVWKY